MTEPPKRWQFWIDRGGTFTDCLGVNPVTGRLSLAKVLSSDRAPLVAMRELLARATLDIASSARQPSRAGSPASAAQAQPEGANEAQPIPACDIRMGTTIATNALLERRGADMALVISQGFGDALELGTGARSDLFALDIQKPAMLYRRVLEVPARVDPQGNILERPDKAVLTAQLAELLSAGIRSLAIVVLHSYANPSLEREIAELAQGVGFSQVFASHDSVPELGLIPRGNTAMVDAYLTPLLRDYLHELKGCLPGSSLMLMQSSGVLASAERFAGPNATLSGPAGGVVGFSAVARQHNALPAIGFDMGGTSTDVSRYLDRLPLSYQANAAGFRLLSATLDIHTVAAGGGSICGFQDGRLRVGPESAGATPGPLCYGHPAAHALTLTDVNLVLGRLRGDRFPFPLELERAERALLAVGERLSQPAEQVADGFFRVATASMAEAIRKVSVSRGYDAREHTLVVFGGAGGQHACALARELGITRILVHPLAGVLSAYGMGLAQLGWHGSRDAGRRVLTDAALRELAPQFSALCEEARVALKREGESAAPELVRLVDLAYQGTENYLTLPFGAEQEGELPLRAAFEREHTAQFGYHREGHPISVSQIRVQAVTAGAIPPPFLFSSGQYSAEQARYATTTRIWFGEGWTEGVAVVQREQLEPGARLTGPALVLDQAGSLVLEPDFQLFVASDGTLELSRALAPSAETEHPVSVAHPNPPALPRNTAHAPDPVLLEIFANRFMSIAEQMGQVLQRTAFSTNIRERLDFSCAVFDPHGNLVANAPHIPVHLGAMGESVRAIIAAHPRLSPGESYVTNDPAGGGSHLPDITVVSPVFDAGQLQFFVASRGHHADVGGITPGSMPPFSSTLAEEGVLLRCLPLVRGERLLETEMLEALTSGPFPARDPQGNIADLVAQVAANRAGANLLSELCHAAGTTRVQQYMQFIQDNAAEVVAARVSSIPDGRYRFSDQLDDGTPICVELRVDGANLTIDFAGTAKAAETNLNAPKAVTIAAVLYVLRCLVGYPIPLNDGCLRRVSLLIPQGSLLDPPPNAAVAGGNVETSQRVVDVLLGALGLCAASQGTMNNLTFGDEAFGYYETIGGGAGAGPGFPGASGVQTHMTNTRITDPEVLEARYPVRVRRFALRTGSGGEGEYPGGNGVIRELEFLRPLSVAILSERRLRAPFGLHGGGDGLPGHNRLGTTELPPKAQFKVGTGERLTIQTPGGGAYGAPRERSGR